MSPYYSSSYNTLYYITVDCNQKMYVLQVNIFQVVIAADQQMAFVFFIYHDIQWGEDANIGFSAGDGTRSFMVPGSLTNQTVNIDEGSNVGVRGVYIYQVDLCSVIGPNYGEKPKIVSGKHCWENLLGKMQVYSPSICQLVNATCGMMVKGLSFSPIANSKHLSYS